MKAKRFAVIWGVLGLMLVLLAGLAGACSSSTTTSQSTSSTSASTSVSTKKITLRLAIQSFPTEPITVAIDDFAKAFNERAQGKAEIVVYGNGSLGLSSQYLDMVRTGAVELAEIPVGMLEQTEPIFIAPSLPFMFNNAAARVAAKDKMADAVFNNIFEQQFAQKALAYHGGPAQNIGSTKKAIKTLDDLKNMLVAAAAPAQFSMLKALGSSPVSVAGPEMYGSLEKGIVDATLMPSDGVAAMKLFEVMHYWTVCEMHTSYGVVTVNSAAFNKLPDDLKTILVEEGTKLGAAATEKIFAAETETSDQLKQAGMEFYVLPSDEKAKWQSACQPIWDEYVQKAGADGEKLIAIAKEVNAANP